MAPSRILLILITLQYGVGTSADNHKWNAISQLLTTATKTVPQEALNKHWKRLVDVITNFSQHGDIRQPMNHPPKCMYVSLTANADA